MDWLYRFRTPSHAAPTLRNAVLAAALAVAACASAFSDAHFRITGQYQALGSQYFGAEVIELSSDFELRQATRVLAVSDSAFRITRNSGLVTHAGAIHMMYINEILLSNGTRLSSIVETAVITDGIGLPEGTLQTGDYFGVELAQLPDLDGDAAVREIAVGSMYWGPNNRDYGAVFILFLSPNASVTSVTILSHAMNGAPPLNQRDAFGRGVSAIGPDTIAVSAIGDDTAGFGSGALYVLRLNTDGSCREYTKFTDGSNGLPVGSFQPYNFWGVSVEAVGDLNGDGNDTELIVCAALDQTGGSSKGACLVLEFSPDFDSVRVISKIADGRGGIDAGALKGFNFGMEVSWTDIDGDGSHRDLIVAGAPYSDRTALYAMRLSSGGEATSFRRLKTYDYIPAFGRSSSSDTTDEVFANQYDYHGDGLASISPVSNPFGPTDMVVGAPGSVVWASDRHMDWNTWQRGVVAFFNTNGAARVSALDAQQGVCEAGGSSAFAAGVVPEIRAVFVVTDSSSTANSQSGHDNNDDNDGDLDSGDDDGYDSPAAVHSAHGRLKQGGGTRVVLDVRVPTAWRVKLLPAERISRGLPLADNDEDPRTMFAFTRPTSTNSAVSCTRLRQRRSSCGAVVTCRSGPGLGQVVAYVAYDSAQRRTNGSPTVSERSSVLLRYDDPVV